MRRTSLRLMMSTYRVERAMGSRRDTQAAERPARVRLSGVDEPRSGLGRWGLALIVALLGGCGRLAQGQDAGRPSEDGGLSDAELRVDGESVPPATGSIVLDACLGQTGVAERCTLVTNASACVGARCSKLVVVFSGGEMGCVTGTGYREVLDGYAARGYAAVCINYFDTSMGSSVSPYVDEAARIDLAVREATTGAWARAYWTGEDLLLQGISHGATAPVILMARTSLDEQPHWRGSRATAGCFFDGAYDQAATASLLATGAVGGGPCTTPVSLTRWLERYCGAGATPATCDLRTNAKAREDTITGVGAEAFAIRDFKMFECGSALRACSGDIVAGAPIEALCRGIDGASTHTCAFGALPSDGHLTCHRNEFDSCRTWFEALPRR
jgi:hypothetical protein